MYLGAVPKVRVCHAKRNLKLLKAALTEVWCPEQGR